MYPEHTPEWAAGVREKAAVLQAIYGQCKELLAALDAYATHHGRQTHILRQLAYAAPYQAAYAPMVGRLSQVGGKAVHEDAHQHAWGLSTLSPLGGGTFPLGWVQRRSPGAIL